MLSAGGPGSGRGLSYRLLEDRLHTDAPQVTLTYIFRPHESAFPAFFASALVARLSAEFCIPLTESTARAQMQLRQAFVFTRTHALLQPEILVGRAAEARAPCRCA